MPWTIEDVDEHKKGLTKDQKELWVKVANDALARCEKKKGKDCEGSAIRQASSVVDKAAKEAAFHDWYDEQPEETQELLQEHIDGLKSALQKERAARKELQSRLLKEAPAKTEDDKKFPASDYAYVPDPEHPSTWKLRLTAEPGGSPDSGIVGAACAALSPGGFRGKKVQIPAKDLPAVKRKVRAAWKKANPDKDAEEMPASIKEAMRIQEGELWGEDLRLLLRTALNDEAGPTSPRTCRYWIKDVAVQDSEFVYEDEQEGGLYKRGYTVGDTGKVTLGAREEVRAQTAYLPVGEALDIEGDFVALVEKAVRSDGTIPIKIIQPGWGMTGYYPSDVLERDGATAFPSGTKMFWDHPTLSEEAERPERSLRDMAGELVGPARWHESGPEGPGLYADAQVFSDYQGPVNELAPHMGVSIRALGKYSQGEAEGKKGKIIEKIVGAHSVDFVTAAGAGGKILELFESARRRPAGDHAVEEGEMKELEEAQQKLRDAEAEVTRLKEIETEAARLKEALLLREAKDLAGEMLAKEDIPEMTRTRLVESLAKDPPIKDGKLDEEAFKTKITEALRSEIDYLAKVTGSGAIKGMGGKGGEGAGAEELKEAWVLHFRNQGSSPEEAEKLAGEAMRGRR